MNIEDAFTEEAIAAYDTNVEGDEEEELRKVVTQIFVTNEFNWSDDAVRVAMLAFVAGRTSWADQHPVGSQLAITAAQRLQVVMEFAEFLDPKEST